MKMDKGGGAQTERQGGPTASVVAFLTQRLLENRMLEKAEWQEKAHFQSKIIDNCTPTKRRKVWARELKSRKRWGRKGL